jgi:hypothetical protein
MDWRRVAGLGAVSLALAIPAAVFGLPLAVHAFVSAIALIMSACVWFAMSLSTGVSVWTLIGVVGRATAATLATPRASAILAALVAIAALAAYALQRLLGSEQEHSG